MELDFSLPQDENEEAPHDQTQSTTESGSLGTNSMSSQTSTAPLLTHQDEAAAIALPIEVATSAVGAVALQEEIDMEPFSSR